MKINEITKVEEYNPKIDARFIRYLSQIKPYTYDDVKNSQSEYNKVLKTFLEIKSSHITLENIFELYKIMSNNNVDSITKEYLKGLYDKKTLNELIDNFKIVIKKKLFAESSAEMAILIFNCQMINLKYIPIVFYPSITGQMVRAIENNESDFKIEKMFRCAYLNTFNKLNFKRKVKSKEKVISIILNHKDMLKDLYQIESLGLFGSFARGEQNEYSDMDVWIKVLDKISNQKKYQIKSLLEGILDLAVDLNIWTPNLAKTVFHDSLKIF